MIKNVLKMIFYKEKPTSSEIGLRKSTIKTISFIKLKSFRND